MIINQELIQVLRFISSKDNKNFRKYMMFRLLVLSKADKSEFAKYLNVTTDIKKSYIASDDILTGYLKYFPDNVTLLGMSMPDYFNNTSQWPKNLHLTSHIWINANLSPFHFPDDLLVDQAIYLDSTKQIEKWRKLNPKLADKFK